MREVGYGSMGAVDPTSPMRENPSGLHNAAVVPPSAPRGIDTTAAGRRGNAR